MTHQRALAESVYAVGMAEAAMRDRLDDFERDMRALLAPTSAIYRRRDADWTCAAPTPQSELDAAMAA